MQYELKIIVEADTKHQAIEQLEGLDITPSVREYNKPETMYDLKAGFEADLEDNKDEILELKDEDEQRERISEMVDSAIPVYNQLLLELAISDLWLATDEPEFLAFGGNSTAVACIAGNVYQDLQEMGQEWLDKVLAETVEVRIK